LHHTQLSVAPHPQRTSPPTHDASPPRHRSLLNPPAVVFNSSFNMTSLARLRCRLSPAIVGEFTITVRLPSDSYTPHRPFARSLQTSADMTLGLDFREAAQGLIIPTPLPLSLDGHERRMERSADALYKFILGFCHLAIGQVRYFADVSPLTYYLCLTPFM
jgi:hypothetical protein